MSKIKNICRCSASILEFRQSGSVISRTYCSQCANDLNIFQDCSMNVKAVAVLLLIAAFIIEDSNGAYYYGRRRRSGIQKKLIGHLTKIYNLTTTIETNANKIIRAYYKLK